MVVSTQEGFHVQEVDELRQRPDSKIVERTHKKIIELVAAYTEPIDETLDHDEKEKAIAKREGAMSGLKVVFQILIMDRLNFDVGQYEQERGNPPISDSDVFRKEFTPRGELKEELDLLLTGDTEKSLQAVTEFFQRRHRAQAEATNLIDN